MDREVSNSDKAPPTVPVHTKELAYHATNDIVGLAVIAAGAPPEVQQALASIGETFVRLTTHVMATLEEGAECANRIEKRTDDMMNAIKAKSASLLDSARHSQRGEVMRSIFDSRPRAQMGFRSPDSHVES